VFEVSIPVPSTLLEATWFALGLCFGRSFGKRLDYYVQQSEWYEGLEPWQRWLVKSALNLLHHWWVGLLLMVYVAHVPELYWFGAGLLVDDLPDIPARVRKYLKLAPIA